MDLQMPIQKTIYPFEIKVRHILVNNPNPGLIILDKGGISTFKAGFKFRPTSTGFRDYLCTYFGIKLLKLIHLNFLDPGLKV